MLQEGINSFCLVTNIASCTDKGCWNTRSAEALAGGAHKGETNAAFDVVGDWTVWLRPFVCKALGKALENLFVTWNYHRFRAYC